jgi:ribonuclease P protein component
VVVSKKVAKSAVTRNRIRRRLYEIVRKNDHLISTPLDVVILVYSETVATMPSEKLEAQITSLLQKTTNQTHS